MFEIELADGAIVHAPQAHRPPPLLHLAVDGRVFVYMPGGFYQQADPRRAIDLVFARWDEHRRPGVGVLRRGDPGRRLRAGCCVGCRE
jgi:hypothetical protein